MSFTLFLPTVQRETIRERYRSPIILDSLSPAYRAPAGTIDSKTIDSPKFRFRKSEPETKERTGDDESIAVPAIYDVELEPTDRSRLQLVRERTYARTLIDHRVGNNGEKRGGYIRGKRSREICEKTVKNVLIERNDEYDDDENVDDSRWRPSIEVSSPATDM